MFTCNVCDQSFNSHRALNGHKQIHNVSPRKPRARKANIRSRSTFVCHGCGTEKEYNPHNSKGKFCSRECQNEHKWQTHTLPKILSGTSTNSSAQKKYLAESRGNTCELCKCEPIHNGLPLVFQLDHIDGDSSNNVVSNLRLLCPNCHTQTPTYGSKNNNKGSVKQTARNMYLRNYQTAIK